MTKEKYLVDGVLPIASQRRLSQVNVHSSSGGTSGSKHISQVNVHSSSGGTSGSKHISQVDVHYSTVHKVLNIYHR